MNQESERILLTNKAFCKICKQLIASPSSNFPATCSCGNVTISFNDDNIPVHAVKDQEYYIDTSTWISQDELIVGNVYTDLLKVLNTLEKAAVRVTCTANKNKTNYLQIINDSYKKIDDLINDLDKNEKDFI